MRTLRRTTILVTLSAVILSAAVLGWPRQCPVSLRIVSLQPSDVYSDSNADFWLLHVATSNHSSALVTFDPETLRAEAKVGSNWIAAPTPAPLSSVRPRHESQELVLVPAAAEAYRIRLRYAFRPNRFEVQLSDWASRTFPGLYGDHPLGRLLTDRWYEIRLKHPPQQKLRWRHGLTPALTLPERQTEPGSWPNDGL
jgi:hypothetical protein